MRKFILVFLLLTSSILARDLLAIASNNALSDSSSKRLSDSELSEVVGGLFMNAWDGVGYSLLGGGHYRLYQSYTLSLTQEEKLTGSVKFYDNENPASTRANYLNFIDRMSIGIPTIICEYDSFKNTYTVQFALVDKSGRYWHMADTFANKLKYIWTYGSGLPDAKQRFAFAQEQLRHMGAIK